MSKIIYYMGAGASYGKKEAREVIDKGTKKRGFLFMRDFLSLMKLERVSLLLRKRWQMHLLI